MKFVTDAFSEDESNVVFFGVDCPVSVRIASQLVEPFDVTEGRNFLENSKVFDSGDVNMGEVEERVRNVLGNGRLPLMYSKEHTASLHAMKAMPDGTKLVVFDAHADLKDKYEGSGLSHACWLRRWCEIGDCGNIVILGFRSGDEDEVEFAKSNGIKYFTSRDVKEDREGVKEFLDEFLKGSKFYLSLDMDVFDPSISPAVKYPEPGGLTYNEFRDIIESMITGNLVGMDFNELRPFKENRISEFLAVKAVFTALGSLVR